MKVQILWKGCKFSWCVVSQAGVIKQSLFVTYYRAKDWAKAQGYEVVK